MMKKQRAAVVVPSPSSLLRVARGAGFLDSVFPAWWQLVDPLNLDLSSMAMCVLGQVYGDFGRGLRVTRFHDDVSRNVMSYGFCGGLDSDLDWELADLKAAWILAVEKRRSLAGA